MANSISQAFKGLSLASAELVSDHTNIYDVSYQYLSNVSEFKDKKALQNCLVALINLDRYHKAKQLLDQVPSELHQDFVVEKAYIYYKTGRSDLLEQLYHNHNGKLLDIASRALSHIVAQNAYKEGQNELALKLYIELIQLNHDIDNSQDLSCNEAAILSQANFLENSSNTVEDMLVLEPVETSYDFQVNAALIAISNRNFVAARNILDKAEDICEKSISLEDFDEEVAPIRLLKAYVEVSTGHEDIGAEILGQVVSSNSVNKLVLANNLEALKSSNLDSYTNANLILRILEYQPNLHKLHHKLTQPQIQSLTRNNLRLRLLSKTLNKSSSYFSSKYIKNWIATFPGDISPIFYKIIITLGIDLEKLEQNHKQYSKLLFKWINSKFSVTSESQLHGNEEFVAATLILISLNHFSNNYNQSLKVLEESMSEIEIEKLCPALVGGLIKIYENLNSLDKLDGLYNRLMESVLKQNELKGSSYELAKLVGFKLLLTDKEKSQIIFEKLQKSNETDGLVNAVLTGETGNLTPFTTFQVEAGDAQALLSVDVDELVDSRTLKNNKKTKTTINTSKSNKHNNKVNKKKNYKFSATKVVVPEEKYDGLGLDKERWLPMTLRSYYKPSKKDKKKSGGGHQGALVAEGSSKKKKKGKK